MRHLFKYFKENPIYNTQKYCELWNLTSTSGTSSRVYDASTLAGSELLIEFDDEIVYTSSSSENDASVSEGAGIGAGAPATT